MPGASPRAMPYRAIASYGSRYPPYHSPYKSPVSPWLMRRHGEALRSAAKAYASGQPPFSPPRMAQPYPYQPYQYPHQDKNPAEQRSYGTPGEVGTAGSSAPAPSHGSLAAAPAVVAFPPAAAEAQAGGRQLPYGSYEEQYGMPYSSDHGRAPWDGAGNATGGAGGATVGSGWGFGV